MPAAALAPPGKTASGGDGPGRRLADLDQVTVRVANVGADLVGMLFGLSEELGALG
jgi:hypothetical protein